MFQQKRTDLWFMFLVNVNNEVGEFDKVSAAANMCLFLEQLV